MLDLIIDVIDAGLEYFNHHVLGRHRPKPPVEPETPVEPNWDNLPCPQGCGGRVRIDYDCPGWKRSDGQIMRCVGCGNATRYECRTPDEEGDLVEDGCGWWFQHPLHEEASDYALMGAEPPWDYRHRL